MRTKPIDRSEAFGGHNFMTPILVGYRRGTYRGRVVHVEISKEREPFFSQMVGKISNGGPAYGLTVKNADGTTPDPDPSTNVSNVQSFDEVERALLEME